MTTRSRRRVSRRRRRVFPFPPAALLLVLLLLLAGAWIFTHARPSGQEEDPAQGESLLEDLLALADPAQKDPPELPDWVTVDLLPVNEYSRPGIPLEGVRGIVVHYVGNPNTSARNNHNYFAELAETGAAYASSHFVIGMEGEVIQNVPLDEVAYCSNDRNSDTLSIECCHPTEEGWFTQDTYDTLVELVRFLADYYGLDREDVIRHYDVTGKECPRYYVDNPDAWERFKDDVFGN